MTPELIKFFEDDDSQVNVCRVSYRKNRLYVTHHREVSEKSAELIAERRHNVLAEVKAIIPHVVDFGILPEKNGEKTVKCAVLTIAVNVKYNSIEEINILADFAEEINLVILKSLYRDTMLRNISLDMKQFDDEGKIIGVKLTKCVPAKLQFVKELKETFDLALKEAKDLADKMSPYGVNQPFEPLMFDEKFTFEKWKSNEPRWKYNSGAEYEYIYG